MHFGNYRPPQLSAASEASCTRDEGPSTLGVDPAAHHLRPAFRGNLCTVSKLATYQTRRSLVIFARWPLRTTTPTELVALIVARFVFHISLLFVQNCMVAKFPGAQYNKTSRVPVRIGIRALRVLSLEM